MPENTIDLTASPSFASWLHEQRISIAFTSYRAGKLITLGSGVNGQLTASDCSLERCMGLGQGEGRLWVASAYQLWRFVNILGRGQIHEGHDAVFLPVSANLTGAVDVHDIAETAEGKPIFVVPRLNCLATLSEAHSFKLLWQPPFITDVVAEDRCHLNGLAMQDGAPRFVTCLAKSNKSGEWRDHKANGGLVIDVQSGDIVASGLSMPHSPRLYNETFWMHQSGTGEFGRLDLKEGLFEPVAALPGLPRGLSFVGRWAVIGVSKPRGDSEFDGLPLGERLTRNNIRAICAIFVIDLQSGQIEHVVEIGPDVEELYDVVVIPMCRNPRLIDPKSDEARYFLRPEIRQHSNHPF